MNTKHRLAFAALIATPILATTLPAEGATGFTPSNASVYETIQIDLTKIEGTVESYSWAVVDGTTETPILGLTGNSFTLKPEHSGKSIKVTANLKDKEPVSSTTLVKVMEPKFNGDITFVTQTGATISSAYEGMTLQIKAPTLQLEDGVNVPQTDVTYAYSWYKVVGTAREKIPVSAASYTIPASFKAGMPENTPVNIEAEVTATIKGLANMTPLLIKKILLIEDNPVEDLVKDINNLQVINENDYYYIYNMTSNFTAFKEHITNLQHQVNSLPGTLKTQVTNASFLQTVQADILAAENVLKLIALATDSNKVSDIEKAQKAASNLNQRQLSLVQSEYDAIFKLSKSTESLDIDNDITPINKALIALYGNDDSSLEDLVAQMKEIEAAIAAVPKQFHGLLQTEHLTKAKQNVNAVRNFNKKIALLPESEENATAKDIKNAEAAYNAYIKLTHEQTALIDSDSINLILAIIGKDTENATTLINNINTLYKNEDSDSVATIQQHLNELITTYKALSTKSKKLVTNYPKLQELQKALKDAARVEGQIMKLQQYDAEVNLKSAKTKLQAAERALIKLTPLAHSFVMNKESITALKDDVVAAFDDIQLENEVEPSSAATKFEETINGWAIHDDYMTYGDFSSFSEFETSVNELNLQFKGITSKERNNLLSKIFLTSAKSDIKAVKNAVKKITAAIAETKESKRYTRILSAERAVAKLSSTQFNLLLLPYTDGGEIPYEQLQEAKEAAVSISNLDNTLKSFKQGGYNQPIEDLQTLISEYEALNSTVKKLVVNGDMIKTLTKDIKTVTSFTEKHNIVINEHVNATLSQKKAFVTAYAKLTFLQHSLLDEEIAYIVKDIRSENAVESTSTLYNEINDLIVDGAYTNKATSENIASLKEQYKQLSTDERRVISNYDTVLTAEKHIEKVQALIDSKPKDLTTTEGIAWLNKMTLLKPLEASLLEYLTPTPPSTP